MVPCDDKGFDIARFTERKRGLSIIMNMMYLAKSCQH